LYPKGRNDKGKIRSVDSDTILGLVNLRKEMPDKPLLILLKTARERSIIPIGVFISRATAYRIFQQHAEDLKKPAEDRRKFEAEKVNSLWQSDVMHGPQVVVNGEKQKSYLLAIIDDHSRLIVQAQFYLHERIIDEASLLRLEIFQELHTINHFENNPIPQLPIILAGQNSLIDILQYHNSRAFASRVVARSKLEPFSITETEKYLYHHLTIAGNNQRIFTEPAITAIHKISAGMLRKINNIARSLSDLGNRSEKNDKLRQIFWFFEANSTVLPPINQAQFKAFCFLKFSLN